MKIEIDNNTFKCKAHKDLMKLIKEIRGWGEIDEASKDIIGPLVIFTLEKRCESEIERKFFLKAIFEIPTLLPQVEFENYRFDFGILGTNVLIELDGHDYHKTRRQRTRDAERQRYLELRGFRVIRFTGSEVYWNPDRCVQELKDSIVTFADCRPGFIEYLNSFNP